MKQVIRMGLSGVGGYYVVYTLLTLLLFIVARKKIEEIEYAKRAFFLAAIIGAFVPLLSFVFGSILAMALLAIAATGLAVSLPFGIREEADWVYVPLEEKEEHVEEVANVGQGEDHLLVMTEQSEQEMNDLMNYQSFSAPAEDTHSMIEEDMPLADFKTLDLEEQEFVWEESETVPESQPVLESAPEPQIQPAEEPPSEPEADSLDWEWETSFVEEIEKGEEDGVNEDNRKVEDEPISEEYFTRLGDVMKEEGISFERLDNQGVRLEDVEEGGQHRA